MFYYGLFYCDENLCPITGEELLEFASCLKIEFATAQYTAKVYLLGAGVDGEAAAEHRCCLSDEVHNAGFTAPVNLFAEVPEYLGMEELGQICGQAKPEGTPSFRTYFVVPYQDSDPLWNPELGMRLLDTDVAVVSLVDAYEVADRAPQAV